VDTGTGAVSGSRYKVVQRYYHETLEIYPVAFGSAAAYTGEPRPIAKAEPILFPFRQDGKWGYINSKGEVVVAPQFEHAFSFHDERALALRDKKYVLLNAAGKVIADAPCRHDVKPFSDGVAEGSIGLAFRFFDRDGQLLPGEFAGTFAFTEGLGAACVNPARFDGSMPEFGPGPPGQWGFIDRSGDFAIPARYFFVRQFSEGVAAAYIGGKVGRGFEVEGGKWGFIDNMGRVAIEPQFAYAAPFSEGLAKVSFDHNTYGYINRKGEIVIEPRAFMMADQFHDGLSAIRGGEVRGGTYYKGFGFMDRTGKVVIPEEFDYVQHFSDGLAAARVRHRGKRQWGFIDKLGEWAIEPQFDHVSPFRGGLANVEGNKKSGYIDRDGKFVWPLSN
jgi:hypothetical protein